MKALFFDMPLKENITQIEKQYEWFTTNFNC